MALEEKFYLLVCCGGVELVVDGGPYNEDKLMEAARHEKHKLADQDNLYWLAVGKGSPRTGSFSNNELQEE
jgi:hypothetical protein